MSDDASFVTASTVTGIPTTASLVFASTVTSIPTSALDGESVANGTVTASSMQTSRTAVTSSATSPSSTPSPSLDAPASPTAGVPHRHSNFTRALAGGVSGGVLLFAVFAFFLLRRRRRRHPRTLSQLDPAPFIRMSSENTLYPWNQSAAARARAAPPPPDTAQHKAPGKGLIRLGASAVESAVATSSQSTNEKNIIRMVPPREEPEDASGSLQGSSREAILAQEVVALRMRIRAMESLQGEGPSSGRASASESDAPPDYEDEGIPL